jgi:methanogenic corrinoid protein MtbC1
MKHEIYQKLSDAVLKMDEEAVVSLSKEAIEKGIDLYLAITLGLAAGMKKAGELYDKGEYYVPELLLCSDALYAGLEIFKPYIQPDQSKVTGKLMIGVVEGDIHDIGKNLVRTMFEAEGWEVCDLGKDVKIEKFQQEYQRIKADVIALSALMTTSMLAMPKIIELLKGYNPEPIVIVGGAPLSKEIAHKYGADGYSDNAKGAVAVAKNLLASRVL